MQIWKYQWVFQKVHNVEVRFENCGGPHQTAAPAPEGDMIVFRQPRNPSNFIIHRAIDRINSGFETKGDNNEYKDDWLVPENYLIGKVIGRLPLLGYLFLLIRTPLGLLVFITTILLLIVQEYISLNKNRKNEE